MKLQDFLKAQVSCEKARKWAKKLSLEAYLQCHRGDWLLLLHGKLYPDFNTYPDQVRKRVLVAGLIANLVRDRMTDERSIAAVNAAIAFGKGEIGIDRLNEVAKSAYAVTYLVYTANSNSAKAANAAINAAYAAEYPTYAANAVNYAAYSADVVAAEIQSKSADIFRDHISFKELSILF